MKKMIFLFTLCMFLALGSAKAYETYSIGDVVTYLNERYYVIANSDSEQSYVTLLKKNSLSESLLNTFGGFEERDNPIDSSGVPYYYSSTCKNWTNRQGCSTDFNSSKVKEILDKWVMFNIHEEDLEEVEGYKVRLLTKDELIDNLGYDVNVAVTGNKFTATENVPNWIYSCDITSSKNCFGPYWTMTKHSSTEKTVFTITEDGYLTGYVGVYTNRKVRPVINLKKDAITSNNYKDDGSFKVGDVVTYKDEYYIVIKDSSKDEENLVLLKNNFLSANDITKYKDDSINSEGRTVKYYSKCSEENQEICQVDYDQSDVKAIIDNWAQDKLDSSDLLEDKDGYKVRIISFDELVNIGFESTITATEIKYDYSGKAPSFLNINGTLNFWTMFAFDNNYQVFVANNSEVSLSNVYNYNYIRPVINIKKSAVNVVSSQNNNGEDNIVVKENGKVCTIEHQTLITYAAYNVGEIVKFKGEEYLVIANSKKSQNFVTLLKMNSLTSQQLKAYSRGTSSSGNIGLMPWSDSENTVYNNSYVKIVVDNWINDKLGGTGDLAQDIDGNYASLLDIYVNNLAMEDYKLDRHGNFTDNSPYWMHSSDYSYWNYYGRVVKNEQFSAKENVGTVRPVINLSWNYLQGQGYSRTSADPTKKIEIGTEIEYKGITFFVLDDDFGCTEMYRCEGSERQDINAYEIGARFVRLIKSDPLTQEEIDKYSTYEKNGLPFYTSDTCTGTINNGCTNEYDNSNIRNVVDNWTIDNFNEEDLVQFEGYKTRLITSEDLILHLGYNSVYTGSNQTVWMYSSDTPEEVYNVGYRYWTMSPFGDTNSEEYVVQESLTSANVYGSYAVRPVVNLNKCSLENGCEKQEYDLEVCEDEPSTPLVVPVGNTFKSPIFIMSLISGILVISGVIIFVVNYRKSLKEKNK